MQASKYFPDIHGNLGFSSMRLPMNGDKVDIEKLSQMVDAFLEAGFNYFDTGHDLFEGGAELALRKCVSKRYPREDFVLTNKLKESCFMKQKDIRPLFERQLEMCGVAYFDFYLMDEQNQFNYQIFKEQKAYETVAKLKEEGKIRHVGITFHDAPEVLDVILSQHPEIDVVQIQFNYADYTEPPVEGRNLYDICMKHGKAVIATSPIKNGKLANLPEEAERVLHDMNGGSNASYAIRFAASFPNTILTLPSTSDLEHLKENCSVMKEFHPMDEAEKELMRTVSDALYSLTEIPCIACRHCLKDIICPRSIRIPDLFATLNNYVAYHDRNAKYYYHNVVTGPGHGKASDCVMCGSCEKVCPQQLNIRKLMMKVAETFE